MCRKFKKRHRKDLNPDDIEAIVAAAKVPHRLHKDIANEFKVPAILVGQLVKESAEQPTKLDSFRAKLELNEQKKQVIESVTTDLLALNTPLVRVQQVQRAVEESAGIDVSLPQIRQVLKKEMRMGYRKTNVVPI